MTREMWINLPVKDINRSKTFFTKLGSSFNEQRSSSELASLVIGEKHFTVNLFKDSTFETFVKNKIADANEGTEVLLSISAESREEADEMLRRALGAGGNDFYRVTREGRMDVWLRFC